MDLLGNAYASGLRHFLQARGDIYAVTEDVVAIDDDIAEIDAHAVQNAPIFRSPGFEFGHLRLRFDGISDGSDDAREFCQQSVAHQLDDATAMLFDPGGDQIRKSGLETRMGAGLIRTHESRIANHIGRKDCRQSALVFLHHGRSLPADV